MTKIKIYNKKKMLKKIILLTTLILSILPCPNSDQLCTQCEGTKCVECRKSVPSSDGKCKAVTTEIDSCMEYKTDTQCKRCIDFYTLNDKKKCYKITIENCSSLKTVETCRSCGKSMMPSDDGKKCTENLCSIKNCDLCFMDGSNTFCQRCVYDFVRSSDKKFCVMENDNTRNCYTLDMDGNCDECMDGYYMSDGKCLVSSQYTFEGFKELNSWELVFKTLFSFFLFVYIN